MTHHLNVTNICTKLYPIALMRVGVIEKTQCAMNYEQTYLQEGHSEVHIGPLHRKLLG